VAVSENSFTWEDRLPDAGAFSRVFNAADARASHKYLLLLAATNGMEHHRLGIIVARKNVKLAVQRNRFKRITREFFRTQPGTTPGLDVIVMARKGVDTLDNETLSSILRQQWQKLLR
jgi:ribonuclease P protein component